MIVSFRSALPVIGMLLLFSGKESAEAAAPPRESTMTLQQIVARQEQTYARMRAGTGEVVWTERRAVPTTVPASRIIFFAFDSRSSVNMVMPYTENVRQPGAGEKTDWSRVLSAFLIQQDLVQEVKASSDGRKAEVHGMAYNPAVHERNPLVAFHPRFLGDEQVRLADLASLVPQMSTPPRVLEVSVGNRSMIRIDFTNSTKPGETLYYLIDPARGFLNEEIGRLSGTRTITRTKIVIGSTPDGSWIPARREKTEYDSQGRLLAKEEWFYRSLSLNKTIAPKLISLNFFHLPEGTQFYGMMRDPSPGPTPTPAGPTPTPGPRRYGRD